MRKECRRIGFVGTRLRGTDGVSLETRKWVQVLKADGHVCFFFGGDLEWPLERSHLVAEADFRHPEIEGLDAALFNDYIRSPETSEKVARLKKYLKVHLREFVSHFGIDILVAENVLSLPMNVPLGLALGEFLAETQQVTIGHHHDFFWERRRYIRSAASDYLRGGFPPVLPCIRHVVINSFAAKQLALRTGATSTRIPNVMDFEAPFPADLNAYARDLPDELQLARDQAFILQPTRIVPRKRIERSIELVRRLGINAALVISHSAGDEGTEYEEYLREYADIMGARVIFAADRVATIRGQRRDGRKIYSLADMYRQADLVTYPSLIEGFGNAFLEAIYYRKPIVMSHYEIYLMDIEPLGFKVIGFDNFIDAKTVELARRATRDNSFVQEMVEHNHALGCQHYSYRVLKTKLRRLIEECGAGRR